MTRSYRETLVKQSRCDGKQPLSQAVAKRISKQSDRVVHPYRCSFCGKWHVGSSIGKPHDDRRDD